MQIRCFETVIINLKLFVRKNVHHAVSLEAVVCLSEGHEWYLTRIINLNKTTFCTTNKTVLMLNASYDLLQDFGPSKINLLININFHLRAS